MIGKIWKELLVLIVLFGVIWAVFVKFSFDWDGEIETLSIEKEEDLAEVLLDNLFDQYDEAGNDYVDSCLLVMTDRLLETLDSSDYEYKLWILKSSDVNAFATLGGNIFIFSGLFDFVESPEELAIIIAHEIGHVENRHVIDKLTQQIGLEVLFSILTGGDPILLSEVSKILVGTSYERRKEREADEFALQLAEKSRINPRRLAQFFLKVTNEKNSPDESLEILMSHPHAKSRIKASSEYPIPDNFVEEPFGFDWERLKEGLN